MYIGIDNGVSGTVGIVDKDGIGYQYSIPIKKCLNYQKTKVKYLNRVDTNILKDLLAPYASLKTKCLIERPMVNPMRFEATTSALRALEATIIVLEELEISYDYIDSKEWQKALLPYISVKDKKEFPAKLKMVSKEVGMRKYPNVEWENFKDADGILIAEYCKTQWI